MRPGETLATILNCAEEAGLNVPSGCRVGQCESCAVSLTSGSVRHLVDCPDLEDGMCLACQTIPTSDFVIDA
jgi:ferredoxin